MQSETARLEKKKMPPVALSQFSRPLEPGPLCSLLQAELLVSLLFDLYLNPSLMTDATKHY